MAESGVRTAAIVLRQMRNWTVIGSKGTANARTVRPCMACRFGFLVDKTEHLNVLNIVKETLFLGM